MNSEYINSVASEIFKILRYNLSIYWSWGGRDAKAIYFKGMAGLQIRVSAFKHKGYVNITLDEGQDLYNVYLVSLKHEVKKSIEGVYFDELVRVIDVNIETDNDKSEAYKNNVNNWLQTL